MSHLRNINCPNCAAPLSISGNESQVTCTFCGSVIEVPLELRHTPPPPPPASYPPPAIDPFVTNTATSYAYNRRQSSTGRSFISAFAVLILVVGLVGVTLRQNAARSAGKPGTVASPTGVPSAVVASFGGEGTGAGLFTYPSGLAIDGQDYIYVSDLKTRRVQRFDPNGHYVSYWQVALPDNVPVTCLASDRAGNVYACEFQGLRKYNGASGEQLPSGDFTGRSLFGMDAVATLLDGTVVTCACSISDPTIFKFDTTGNVIAKYENVLQPHEDDGTTSIGFLGMAVDGLNNLYILDGLNQHVFVFKADGTFVNRFGGKGQGADQLDFPLGAIAVDGQSNVYIGDREAIKVFDKDGHFERSFSIPASAKAMAFNSTGALYVLGDDKKVYKLNVSITRQ